MCLPEQISVTVKGESKKKWYVPTSYGLIPWSKIHKYDMPPSFTEREKIILSLQDYGHPLYYVFFEAEVWLNFDEDFNLYEVEVRQYLSP
jgi:hypothetical protein